METRKKIWLRPSLRLIAEIYFVPFCESASVHAVAGSLATSLPQRMKECQDVARLAHLFAWLIVSLSLTCYWCVHERSLGLV